MRKPIYWRLALPTPLGRPLGRGIGLGERRFGKPQDVLGVRNLKNSGRSPCADERPLRGGCPASARCPALVSAKTRWPHDTAAAL